MESRKGKRKQGRKQGRKEERKEGEMEGRNGWLGKEAGRKKRWKEKVKGRNI